eukprot:1966918-Amphidinium_carterae.1
MPYQHIDISLDASFLSRHVTLGEDSSQIVAIATECFDLCIMLFIASGKGLCICKGVSIPLAQPVRGPFAKMPITIFQCLAHLFYGVVLECHRCILQLRCLELSIYSSFSEASEPFLRNTLEGILTFNP